MKRQNEVARYVERKIALIENSGDRAAIRAKLRRAAGKAPGTAPDVWEFTLDLPEGLRGESDMPSYAENAVFIALSLYAMHAQGKHDADAHSKDGGSLGFAAFRLKTANPENEPGIKRRFDALATAKSFRELSNHARGIIQLLKAGNISLDYARFAEDLYSLQFPGGAASVKLKWGRDYYRYNDSADDGKGEENE